MEVSSGKSIHHSLIKSLTLQHDVRTILKHQLTEKKGFQLWQVYSSFAFASNAPFSSSFGVSL